MKLNMANRNISLINFYTVCNNLVFMLPSIVAYYGTIGLGFREFLIGEAAFSAVVLLSEMPSGWMSDVWHRRSTLILGLLFAVLGYFWLLIADGLADVIIAQSIIGVAVAFNSGTVSALLYDSLLQEGREEEFRRLEGKRHAIGLYSLGIACILGGLAYGLHPKLPLFLDILTLVAGMIGLAFVIEPERHKKAPETHILRDMAETARYALRHHEIGGIILVSTVIFCASKLMMWANQPYYASLGVPVEWFGVIFAVNQMTGGLAGHWSHKIEHWGSTRSKLRFIAVMLGVSCLCLWLFPSILICTPLFLTGALAYGAGHPTVQNAINTLVGSERRATILSTASLMINVLSIPTNILMGIIEGSSTVYISLAFLGAQILVLSIIGLYLWKPAKAPVPA